jgi:hypothetical protein
MLNKKAPNFNEEIEAFNNDLLKAKPLHEVEALMLSNQQKKVEIELLYKKLEDYNLTRIVAWSGIFSGILGTLLALFALLKK